MELRHLRYFVMVAETLSFRQAAMRLHVSQPALSSQVQDLEAEIGARLLDRGQGGVRLTAAGTAFLEGARQVLAQTRLSVTAALDAAAGRRGRIAVGYFAPLLMGFMPATLREYNRRRPDVEVILVELPLMDQLAALQTGTIQVAFTIWGRLPTPSDIEHVKILRSPIRVAMHRSHRLAGHTHVSLAELTRETLVTFLPRRGALPVHTMLTREVFKTRGLKLRPVREIEGAEPFRATVESGLGVSLVAEIGNLSTNRELVLKPLLEEGEDLFMELHALWLGAAAAPLAAEFIAMLKELSPVKLKPAKRRRAGDDALELHPARWVEGK